MTKPKYVFKIRTADGLYSTGGTDPRFTNKGKTWTTSGAVNSHIGILSKRAMDEYKRRGCVVVTYLVTEDETLSESIEDRLNASKMRAAERERAYRERIAAWNREKELRELERLKEKYGEVG